MVAEVRRLGELLLEDGAVTVGELHTALEACRRHGGRLGTHLLRLGYVSEPKLLKALARQLGVKPVTTDHLVSQSAKLLDLVPLDVQRRLRAVPFERYGSLLSVAMVNPREVAAREELEGLTGLRVEAYVATERAVRLALDATGAWTRVEEGDEDLVKLLADGTGDSDDWEALWELPVVRRGSLKRALAGVDLSPRKVSLAAFPSLVEIRGDDVLPMTMEEYRSQLFFCRQRDQVGELLMAFARQHLARAILLAVHKDKLSGWMGGGYEISIEDVEALEIPLDGCTVLRKIAATGRTFAGALDDDPCCNTLAMVFGPPRPRELVVTPLRIGKRTAALMVGDQPDGGLDGVPVEVLGDAAVRAGLALEIVILTKKI